MADDGFPDLPLPEVDVESALRRTVERGRGQRRRRRAAVGTLAAAAAVAVAVPLVRDGDEPGRVDVTDESTTTTALAPLAGDGVVTVEAWLEGDAAEWVERGDPSSERQWEPGPGLVLLAPEGGDPATDEVVVVQSRPTDVATSGVDEPGYLPLGMPCGATSMVVQSPGGLLRVGSRATPLDELEAIGAAVDVGDEGDVVIGPVDGWTEVGRLPAGWLQPPDGTVATVRMGFFEVGMVARRLTPATVAVLDALACEDPGRDLVPPASEPQGFMDRFRRRTVDVGGVPATVAAIGTYSVVAYTEDRLVHLDPSFVEELTDDDVRRLLSGMVALPDDEFEARRAALVERRGDQAFDRYADLLPDGEVVVADGWLAERRWALHTADDPDLGAVVCLETVGRTPDDVTTHGFISHAPCPLDVGASPDGLAIGFDRAQPFDPPVLFFAEVPATATSVELTGAAADALSTLVEDARGRRYVLLLLDAEARNLQQVPHDPGEDVADVVFTGGGTATVTIRDADGQVVTTDTLGS